MADPSAAALLFDFDGTLAPIVDDPGAARPADGLVERLDALAARYAVVGIISGRPVSYLAGHLPPSLRLSGLYGLEAMVDGTVVVRPDAERWRGAIAGAADAASASELPVVVEPKGLSVTIHYRTAPEAGPEVLTLASQLAAANGLEVRPAKMSVELHPPVAVDKGDAVRELSAGARAVLFAGDDVGDLPAFTALTALRAEGLTTVGVAVETSELPQALRDSADAVVDGQAGVADLLDALLDQPRP